MAASATKASCKLPSQMHNRTGACRHEIVVPLFASGRIAIELHRGYVAVRSIMVPFTSRSIAYVNLGIPAQLAARPIRERCGQWFIAGYNIF